MLSQYSEAPHSWWKLVLSGLLAFAFGIAAVALPAGIMFQRFLDVISGHAKPLSGGMTAVAALLALAVLLVRQAADNPLVQARNATLA